MKKQNNQPVDNPLRAIPSEEEVLNKILLPEEEAEKLHSEELERIANQYLDKFRKEKRNSAGKLFIQQCSHEQLLKAFPEEGNTSVVHEMIATAEAAFEFIWYSEMDIDLRNAFHQLHRQFNLYAKLVLAKSK